MVIELQAGKIFVFDEGDGQEHWPLRIVTPAGTASARGTWMSVEFDPESGTVEAECLRGICEMENDLGYQVFTNEQTVAATAVTVPTEPAPMDEQKIQVFHALPEVLTEELPIPAPFTPAEVQVKLEKARTEAVERNTPIVERKINFGPASEARKGPVAVVPDAEPAQYVPDAEPVQYVPDAEPVTEDLAKSEADARKELAKAEADTAEDLAKDEADAAEESANEGGGGGSQG